MSVKLMELREPRLDASEPRLEASEPRLLLDDTVRELADRLGREKVRGKRQIGSVRETAVKRQEAVRVDGWHLLSWE